MIITINAYGNHTNQIYQFVQLDAFCKENNIRYINYTLKNLFPFFPELEKKYKSFLQNFIFPILSNIVRVLKKLKFIKVWNLENSEDCFNLAKEAKQNPKKIYFVTAWSHNNNKYFYNNEDLEYKYYNFYKKLFAVNASSLKNKYGINNKNNTISIALHIRRGD